MRPMTPMEFAEAVIDLPLDQAQALISADVAADLAAIQARHTPTAHAAEEAA